MDYYRKKYKNPLFIVLTDDPPKAKQFIWNKKDMIDLLLIGTIDEAVEGKISKIDSEAIDLAILSLCDNVIISHGTFGLWGALLSSSKNIHIMAHDLPKDEKVKPSSMFQKKIEEGRELLEEVYHMKKANFDNFLFMDDK